MQPLSAASCLVVAGFVVACSPSPAPKPAPAASAAPPPSPPSPPSPLSPPSSASPSSPPLPAAPPLPPRIELAPIDRYTFGLAVDQTHVYWADYDSGATGGVYRARKDRAGSRERLAGAQPFARDVAVDDRFVYVACATAQAGPPGAIVRVPKSGGSLEVFAAEQWNPDHVVTHGGRVLWNAAPPGVVRSASSSAAGATAEVVVNSEAFLLRLRGADLFWADRQGGIHYVSLAGAATAPRPVIDVGRATGMPADMAVDDRFVYVADVGNPEMPRRAPCPKNTPCPIATTAPTYRHGEIMRIAISDGARTTIVRDLAHVTRVAVDGARVYFATGGGLSTIAKDGSGAARTIAPDGGITSRIVVDGDRLIYEANQHVVSIAR